jgi:hypothetical protein
MAFSSASPETARPRFYRKKRITPIIKRVACIIKRSCASFVLRRIKKQPQSH